MRLGSLLESLQLTLVTVIESIDENFPKWKSPAYSFISEFHQIFKEEYNCTQIITSVYTNLSNCILLKILNLLYTNYISNKAVFKMFNWWKVAGGTQTCQEPERSSKNKRKTINRMRLKKKYTKKRASERFK